MEGVADEDQRRGRGVHVAVVGVAVPQQHELFEHEENQDAHEQRAEHRARGKIGERFRQQSEQRDPEQGADRVADEPRHQTRPQATGKEDQRRGDEETAAATEKAQTERGREQMHATF